MGNKKLAGIGIFVSLLLLFSSVSSYAFYINTSQNSITVNAAGCTPNCQRVTNGPTNSYYFNNELCGDWNSFLSYPPSGVSLAACCTTQAYSACYSGDRYWYDSCNNREGVKESCSCGCDSDACSSCCTSNWYTACYGSDRYSFDSCDNPEYSVETCSTSGDYCATSTQLRNANGCSGDSCIDNFVANCASGFYCSGTQLRNGGGCVGSSCQDSFSAECYYAPTCVGDNILSGICQPLSAACEGQVQDFCDATYCSGQTLHKENGCSGSSCTESTFDCNAAGGWGSCYSGGGGGCNWYGYGPYVEASFVNEYMTSDAGSCPSGFSYSSCGMGNGYAMNSPSVVSYEPCIIGGWAASIDSWMFARLDCTASNPI